MATATSDISNASTMPGLSHTKNWLPHHTEHALSYKPSSCTVSILNGGYSRLQNNKGERSSHLCQGPGKFSSLHCQANGQNIYVLLVYWSISILVYQSIGLLVYWSIRLLVYWSISLADPYHITLKPKITENWGWGQHICKTPVRSHPALQQLSLTNNSTAKIHP